MKTFGAGLLLSLLVATPVAHGGKPEGGGTGRPGSKAPPNPDIVYMSVGSMSLAGPAIRGVTLATDPAASTDAGLLKASSQRALGNIAWSPDGTRFAWIENGAILTATPGGKPTQLYPTAASDPRPEDGSDVLAWGPGCADTDASLVAFRSTAPVNSIQILEVGADGVSARKILVEFQTHCYEDTYGTTCTRSGASAFAFSPRGHLLAFHGYADNLVDRGVWAVPVCAADASPYLLVDSTAVGGTGPIISSDWSPDGGRLALSVITGPDPAYPWRDIKVAYLGYSFDSAHETVSFNQLRTINLDAVFGSASSEHSPQWGPVAGDNGCQRLAFSQSAGASDGSDMNGRRLFLLDVPAADSSGSCPLGMPLEIVARNPRAIDWK